MRRFMTFTPCKVMLGHFMGDEMGAACATYSGEGIYKVLVEIPVMERKHLKELVMYKKVIGEC
jgi:hypothetical protein